jgi:hypothetical protein
MKFRVFNQLDRNLLKLNNLEKQGGHESLLPSHSFNLFIINSLHGHQRRM